MALRTAQDHATRPALPLGGGSQGLDDLLFEAGGEHPGTEADDGHGHGVALAKDDQAAKAHQEHAEKFHQVGEYGHGVSS